MPVDRHGQREGVQSGSSAVRACNLSHVALHLVPLHVRLGVLVATPQVGHHPLEVGRVDTGPTESVLVPDLHPPSDAALHEGPTVLGRELPPGRPGIDLLILGDRFDETGEIAVPAT